MNAIASMLMEASASILLLLGLVHLGYTFFGQKLSPRNAGLIVRMQEDSPRLTPRTTMWRAWIGFNASHSLGAILFGLIYIELAHSHSRALFASPTLLLIGLVALLGYLTLAARFWFRTPLLCITLSTALYLGAVGLSVATQLA